MVQCTRRSEIALDILSACKCCQSWRCTAGGKEKNEVTRRTVVCRLAWHAESKRSPVHQHSHCHLHQHAALQSDLTPHSRALSVFRSSLHRVLDTSHSQCPQSGYLLTGPLLKAASLCCTFVFPPRKATHLCRGPLLSVIYSLDSWNWTLQNASRKLKISKTA